MKYALNTTLALALAAGLAGTAAAQTGSTANMNSTAPNAATSADQNNVSTPLPQTQSPPAQMQNQAQNYQDQQATQQLSADQVRQAQQQLKTAGLYQGSVDGIVGPETREAIGQFQAQKNLPRTGQLDSQTLAQLGGQSSMDQQNSTTGYGSSSPNGNSGMTPGSGASSSGSNSWNNPQQH
jgi:peptidoglycan hydrolase-like protein with peptidoglycan-binding domain